jgi:hypothetical protein
MEQCQALLIFLRAWIYILIILYSTLQFFNNLLQFDIRLYSVVFITCLCPSSVKPIIMQTLGP